MRLICTLVIVSCSIALYSQDDSSFEPGELFVQFSEGSTSYINLQAGELPAAITEATGPVQNDQWRKAFKIQTAALQGIVHLKLPATTNLEALIEKLETHPDINYAERVPNYQIFYTPNDLAAQQWHLGQVQAEDAWDLSQGSSNVTIAIVDDAIQITHPDLAANIWTNTGEIPNNNVDDDGNGYVDDVNGYDVAMGDNDVNPPGIVGPYLFNHGTHCAGIASAVTDNNTGIASLGFNVRIMPVKISNDQTTKITRGLQGVEYAIINGADVINMSWGGGAYSQTFQLLIDQAYQQGIVCVGAAGNNNTNIPMYPASYNHVINVGSTDQQDRKAGTSTYGPAVDVMAPGASIWSTVPDYLNYYDYLGGTSMASPLVAGLVGLIKSARPGFTVDEITDCILTTADDISNQNPGYPGQLGTGRINAYKAIRCALGCSFAISVDKDQVCPGDTVRFFGTFDSLVSNFTWTFPGGTPSMSTDTNPVVVYPSAGTFDYTLETTCPLGTETHAYQDAITVAVPTASITGTYSVIYGATVLITADLTGVPPYTVTYTDGIDTFTQSGITNSPFLLPYTALRKDTVYLVSITDNNCDGTVSSLAAINIISNDSCTGGVKGRIFQNTYKDFGGLNTHSLEKDEKGYIYTAGLYTQSGDIDVYVNKLDSSGAEVWTTTFGRPNLNENGNPVALFPSETGNVYVGAGAASVILSKFNSNGNLLWTTGPPNTVSGIDYIRNIIELPSGSIIAVGTENSRGPRPSEPFAMKVSASGNTHWYRVYAGPTNNDHTTQAKLTGSNEITLVGSTQSFGPGTTNGLIFKIDTLGNVIWEKYYSPGGRCRFHNFISRPSGITAVGYNRNTPNGTCMAIYSLDHSGNLIWARNYTYNGNTQGVDIEESPFGGFYISGTLEDSVGSKNFMAQLDDLGNVIWARKYGGALPNVAHRFGHNMVVSNTGIVLGGTASNGSYVIQTDFCGNSGCEQDDIQLQVFSINPSTSSTALVLSNYSLNAPINLVDQSHTLFRDTLCTAFITPDTCYLEAGFDYDISCAGDSTLIYSTTDTSYHAINYWDLGDGTVVTGVDSLKHAYKTPGTYTVKLIAFSFQEACSDTVEKQITIPSDFSITGDSVVICLEDSTRQLGPPGLNCGISPFSYNWMPGTGLSDSLTSSPVITPTYNRTYTVVVTDSLGYADTTYYQVTVDSNCCYHDAQVSAEDTLICLGDTARFILTGTNLLSASWDFGSAATPTTHTGLTPPPVYFNTAGYQVISVYYTDSCGPDTLTLGIGAAKLPQPPRLNDTLACAGDTIRIGDPAIAYHEYEWMPPNNLTEPYLANAYVHVTVPETYTVTVTDRQTGCTNTDTIRIDTQQSILPLLIGDTTICINGTIQVTSLKPLPNYSWSTGDTTAQTTITGPGTYWLETERCRTTRDSFEVTPIPAPVLTADTALCTGDTTQFILTGDQLTTATWDFGQGAIPATHIGLTPPSITYPTAGIRTVTAITEGDCGRDTLTMTVEVAPLPSTMAYTDTFRCKGDTVYFGITSNPNQTYQWTPTNDLIDPTSADPGFINDQTTQYQIAIEDNTTGCGNSTTITIETDSLPEKPELQDTIICTGDSIQLTPQNPLQNYEWSTGSTDPSITASIQGTYWVGQTNRCGTTRDTMQLTMLPPPAADAGTDTSIQAGQTAQLNGTATDSFYWSPNVAISCLDCLEPIVNPDDTITYYLTVIDLNGCRNIDSVSVFIIRICENIALPNAFTPNGDNLNDEFAPILVGGDEELILFQVFNRWGELLHETSDPANGWDGTYKGANQPAGSYTYLIRYRCNEGDEPELDYGSVTLIR